MTVHGLLLGYEKTAGIQAAKNRRKKALAFFEGSAKVGIVQIAALAVSVFRRPASRRVFFWLGHRVSFRQL
jgi:hypothetical protein